MWGKPIRNERGLVVLVVTTLVVTALIGGATLLSIIATRQPVSGALDRLDRNQATPEDMQTLQNANQEMARSMQIARAGGSFVGGGGPVPNPAAPGTLLPGEKTLAGVALRIIGRLTDQASQPAPARDNALPPSVASTLYDPRGDPQYGKTPRVVAPSVAGEMPGLSPQEGRPSETSGAIGGGAPEPVPAPPPPPKEEPPPMAWPPLPANPTVYTCFDARGYLYYSEYPCPAPGPRFRPPRWTDYAPGYVPGTPFPCPPGTHRKPGDPTGPCHRN
jgi:hypothetical protein